MINFHSVHSMIFDGFNQYAQSMFNNDLSFSRYVLIASRRGRSACDLSDNLTYYTNFGIYSAVNGKE